MGFVRRCQFNEWDSASSATAMHRCVSSSKLTWVYSIGVQPSPTMALITEFSQVVIEKSVPPRTAALMVRYPKTAESALTWVSITGAVWFGGEGRYQGVQASDTGIVVSGSRFAASVGFDNLNRRCRSSPDRRLRRRPGFRRDMTDREQHADVIALGALRGAQPGSGTIVDRHRC